MTFEKHQTVFGIYSIHVGYIVYQLCVQYKQTSVCFNGGDFSIVLWWSSVMLHNVEEESSLLSCSYKRPRTRSSAFIDPSTNPRRVPRGRRRSGRGSLLSAFISAFLRHVSQRLFLLGSLCQVPRCLSAALLGPRSCRIKCHRIKLEAAVQHVLPACPPSFHPSLHPEWSDISGRSFFKFSRVKTFSSSGARLWKLLKVTFFSFGLLKRNLSATSIYVFYF